MLYHNTVTFDEKWCKRFIELAKTVSTWSKDEHKVGAVIVNDKKQVIGLGYNGFAKGINDSEARLNNKDIKRDLTIHAEENAIINTYENNTDNTTIFIYGYPPCLHCVNVLIQSGIKRIYFYNPNEKVSRYWKKNLNTAKDIAIEAKLIYTDLKEKYNWKSI